MQKTTLVDFPGKVACTLFVDKCNFRCPFCHNTTLVLEQEKNQISEKEALDFLKKRANVLEGVCITGGEPSLHPELFEFIPKAKKLGYKIKIDSNGYKPEFFEKLLKEKQADYIAMDIKAPLEKYSQATGIEANTEKIKESISLLLNSKTDYEFRATVVPGLIELKDVETIGKMVKGTKAFYFQQFAGNIKLLNPEFEKIRPYPVSVLEEMKEKMKEYAEKVEIRF